MQYIKPFPVSGSAQFLNLTVCPRPPSSIVSIAWDTGNGIVSCAAGLELYASLLGERCFAKVLQTSTTCSGHKSLGPSSSVTRVGRQYRCKVVALTKVGGGEWQGLILLSNVNVSKRLQKGKREQKLWDATSDI